MKRTLRIAGCASWLLIAGCGTDLGDALLFAGDSASRTFVDVILSDFFSDAPDLVSFPGGSGDTATNGDEAVNDTVVDDTPADDTAADGTTADDTPQDTPTDTEPEQPAAPEDDTTVELTGDADRGLAVFTANFCTACHCDDASGGCLPTAPDLRGIGRSTLQEELQPDTTHVGGAFPDITAQDIADLETFLAQ